MIESVFLCISRFLLQKVRYLSFGEAKEGMRSYLLIAGGFDMPRNSRQLFHVYT